ncbi:hypothetical protein [Edaphobacter sp. 12200R-103]|nr:hypothetical protein [Edaphobacter sp. 12200R-103]QHS53538.1 hypothetical protein GWR55_18835 [Edaphobacter sp. 12200R-103]
MAVESDSRSLQFKGSVILSVARSAESKDLRRGMEAEASGPQILRLYFSR